MFLLLGAAAVWPFGGWPLPRLAAFGAVAATTTVCFLAMTAYLTLSQAIVLRSRPLVVLAGAYLFVALLGVPYLIVAPDVVGALGGGGRPAAATWLWLCARIGFAVLVSAFVRVQRGPLRPWSRREGRRFAGIVVAAAIVAVVVALAGLPPPPLARLIATVCGLLALGYVAAATRGRTVLQLWLIAVLLAWAVGAALGGADGNTFSAAWYLALIDGVLASAILLGVLMQDVTSAARRLAVLASLDVLSGLANRRALDERLEAHLSGRRRRGDTISLIMIDIDHFKAFNDRYGHATGDECLRAVAQVIRQALSRATDFAARYGGEEFVVLLPATSRDGGRVVAERIRRGVAALRIVAPNAGPPVTVSLGLVTVPPRKVIDPGAVLAAADRALYAAKAAGRNCIFEATRGFVDDLGAASA